MTKYKKVAVSERLPEINTNVIVLGDMEDVAIGYVSQHMNWWQYGSDTVDNIEYWLEEVPDYEDEMREMLEECRLQLEHLNKSSRGTTNSVLSRIETLLSKINQQS